MSSGEQMEALREPDKRTETRVYRVPLSEVVYKLGIREAPPLHRAFEIRGDSLIITVTS